MAFMMVHAGSSEPLYELELPGRREEAARQAQLVLHAALDAVDAQLAGFGPGGGGGGGAGPAHAPCFLRVVDRAAEQLVSAHVTHSGVRLLVLHLDARNEEGIRQFCAEVAELYAKALLNPFHVPGTRVASREFDARVRLLARKHLGMQA